MSEQLLRDALQAAEPTAEGLRKLQARTSAAEKSLQAARTSLTECEQHEATLADQHAALNLRLAQLAGEVRKIRATHSNLVLGALTNKNFNTVLSQCVAKNRSLIDESEVLRASLEYVASELAPAAAIRSTEGRIALFLASRDWTIAAAHADLLALQIDMQVALERDPSLSVNVGPGSKAFGYAEAIARFDANVTTLRETVARQIREAQQRMEALAA